MVEPLPASSPPPILMVSSPDQPRN
jgi:hypothetical protein